MTWLRGRLGDLLVALACAAVVAAGAGTVAGLRAVPVLTGSMSPGIPSGALVLTLPLDVHDLRSGDVVAFRPPPPHTTPGQRPVLHRVVTARPVGAGLEVVTQGDANPAADPWVLHLRDSDDLGRVAAVVPHLGTPLRGGGQSLVLTLAGLLLLLGAWGLASRPAECGCGGSTTA